MDAADGLPAGVALVLLVCAQRSMRQGWLPGDGDVSHPFRFTKRMCEVIITGLAPLRRHQRKMVAEVPRLNERSIVQG